MLISVAICTWNRCHMLKQALQHMTNLVVPRDIDWELIIIDNKSNDATKQTALSFSDILPIRYFFESNPGLSNARNRAVSEARGDYILWTDDDGFVDSLWLAEYCRAFNQWPEAAFFGGPIEPQFVGTPPSWLTNNLHEIANAFSLRDLGHEPILFTIEQNRVPYGTNYAVSMKHQKHYSYNPVLGLSPISDIGGEEVTVIRAMLKDGLKGWWVPTAKVKHHIPKKRQTVGYLRKFFFNQGRFFSFKIFSDYKNNCPLLFKRPRWRLRKALEAELKYHIHHLSRRPEIWIESLMQASFLWGQLFGASSGEPSELNKLYGL